MKWRYGIVKFRHPSNEKVRFYGIGELFYDTDPLKVYACSQEPVEVYTDEDNTDEEILKSIKWQLEMMLKDSLEFPVFDVDGPFEEYPIDENKEEWVELTQEKLDEIFRKEDYAGHIDEVGLAEYVKSIQEEEQGE